MDGPAVAIAFGGLLGLVIGSFAATLVVRWPQGEGAAKGRSRCDACARQLTVAELIPLLSWAVQRGRCRSCRVAINPLHPGMEMLFAAIGAASMAIAPSAAGMTFPLAAGMALALLGWMVATAAILDARHQWLPHALSGLIAASGFALGGHAMAALGITADMTARLIGCGAGFALLWGIGALYRLVRGRQGLGGGDPPFLAALGAWTGWQALPLLLLLASLGGLAAAAVVIVRGRSGRGSTGGSIATMRLPLGTLLALALPFALAILAR